MQVNTENTKSWRNKLTSDFAFVLHKLTSAQSLPEEHGNTTASPPVPGHSTHRPALFPALFLWIHNCFLTFLTCAFLNPYQETIKLSQLRSREKSGLVLLSEGVFQLKFIFLLVFLSQRGAGHWRFSLGQGTRRALASTNQDRWDRLPSTNIA